MVECINNNLLDNVEYIKLPLFNVDIPQKCGDIPVSILNPKESWVNKKEYDIELNTLFNKFNINFITNYGYELYEELNEKMNS